ncbi:hypothetical protein CPLU01_05229 [Colletotrichum plurivorum]|uniref:2EXR domain-containing protein n=1 Tax=Colletotrichum plurivorum TaxID=2175906 RepID=A0A8H6KLU6_9PEZI|nr:hypothetical protein CPLU01_05229 [Colletotrichum plurivorum]
MSETKTFTRFGNLPTELRLIIWSEALSVRSVWAAVFDKLAEFRSRLATRVGPASYPAGLACGESRWLLEQSHVKFPRGPGLATGPGAYWVDPESTTVYLGRAPHARATLDALGADELRQIRHVALRPCQYWSIYEACRRLAKECPALRTIIIHCDGLGHVSEPLVSEDLSPELAAYYATIPGSSIGVGDWNENFDDLQLVSSLEPCFGDSPPMFHVVPSPSPGL